MNHSYKVILYLAILANMRCTCETRKIGEKGANPLKQEQKANNSTEISDEKNNRSKHPLATTAYSYEAIWQQWLNQDNQIAYIKNAINSIIKSMGLLEEEQTKMYNEFYATQLNSDDKVKPLIDELLAYRQQLKYLCDQWPDSKKKDFCNLISKQENPKMLKSLLLLATDDEKKIQQLGDDHVKKKNELVINFIKNSEIVEKMPKKFQEAVLKVIEDNDKKASEKTLAERFEAIFDGIDITDCVRKRMNTIIDYMGLSKEQSKEMFKFYEPLLEADSVDGTLKSFKDVLRFYIKELKKYFDELSAELRLRFVKEYMERKEQRPSILYYYFDLSKDPQKNKNLAKIAIERLEHEVLFLSECIQKQEIINKMPEEFRKAIPEGIKKYKQSMEEKIDGLRKY